MSSWSGVLRVLYIFWRSNPCLRYIGKYVFPYSGLSFHFNAVFFSHAEAFYFQRSHFFILSFMSLALGEIPVKMLLCGISEIFLTMFFYMTLMVSWLIFKPFIHLEFTFVYCVSWRSGFIFLVCRCPALPTPFVEEVIFTPFYPSSPFVKY